MNRKLKYYSLLSAAISLFLFSPALVMSQTIIINKTNPIEKISKSQLRNIFLGNNIAWENGRRIQIVDFVSESPIRKQFDENTLLLPPQKVGMIWVKVSLSGKSIPPKIVHDEEDVKNFIGSNEGAIGYVKNTANLPQSVKIIQVIDE